jgi:hypothetical protein
MATTPKLGMVLLDVGQKQKEATINAALTTLDNAIVITTAGNAGQVLASRGSGQTPIWANPSGYKGEATSDPSATGLPPGSTYYNTSTSKLRVLLSTGSWVNAA